MSVAVATIKEKTEKTNPVKELSNRIKRGVEKTIALEKFPEVKLEDLTRMGDLAMLDSMSELHSIVTLPNESDENVLDGKGNVVVITRNNVPAKIAAAGSITNQNRLLMERRERELEKKQGNKQMTVTIGDKYRITSKGEELTERTTETIITGTVNQVQQDNGIPYGKLQEDYNSTDDIEIEEEGIEGEDQ